MPRRRFYGVFFVVIKLREGELIAEKTKAIKGCFSVPSASNLAKQLEARNFNYEKTTHFYYIISFSIYK